MITSVQLDFLAPLSPAAERTWRVLDEAHPRSYFVTWAWMENWLACLPREHRPRLAVIRDDRGPMAAFFLTRRNVTRYNLLASRALYFNTTGLERFDNLCLEYNGLVGRDLSIGRLVDLLPPHDWDELFLPCLRADAFGGLDELVIRGFRVRVERTVPAYHVDLARVREVDYLTLVGGQTRAQIRRAQREAGLVTTELAHDEQSALEIYDELVALHQRQWRARGKPGAWADPWFDRFHRRLIAQRFRHGEIQLLRVRSPHATIGALYNFIDRGRVLQYQSGMEQFDNKHLKPGFIAHAAAIAYAAGVGHAVYDFLGGEVRYKKSLSTDRTTLMWARVQRLRMRFLVEDRLRDWARARRRPVTPGERDPAAGVPSAS